MIQNRYYFCWQTNDGYIFGAYANFSANEYMEQKNKMCRNVRLWISCQHSLLLCVTFYYLCATILLDMWRYSSWPYYLEIPLKSYATCESRTSITHYEFSNNASMAFSYSYQVQKLARRSCMCYIIWSRFTYYHDKYGT